MFGSNPTVQWLILVFQTDQRIVFHNDKKKGVRFNNSAERSDGEQRHKSSASQTRWEVQNKEVQVIPGDCDDGESAFVQVIPKDLDNGEGDVWADHGRVSNGTQVRWENWTSTKTVWRVLCFLDDMYGATGLMSGSRELLHFSVYHKEHRSKWYILNNASRSIQYRRHLIRNRAAGERKCDTE